MFLQIPSRRSQDTPPDGADVVLVRLASWFDLRAAHPENVMAPLELGQAWALLEAVGITADIMDTELGGWDTRSLVEAVVACAPRLVVVEGISPSVPLMLDLARLLRARLPRVFLLAMGQHATAEPADLLGPGGFHACALAEAEETIAELARALPDGDLGAIPGLVLPGEGALLRGPHRPLRADLDALPWPQHPSFLDRRYRVYYPVGVPGRLRWGFVLASRGCPHSCVYCSGTLRNSYGSLYRHRSPASVAAEVDALAVRGVSVFHFKDDVFSEDRAHTLALCEALARRPRPLPFTFQTRVDRVDPEVLGAARRAGGVVVGFGVETGAQAVADRLRKGSTIQQAREAFRWAREAGLRRVGFFLLGSPGESLTEMEQTLALARELDPDLVQVAFLTPYPGSRVWEELPADERPSLRELTHYNHAWGARGLDSEALHTLQRRFYRELVLSPRVLARLVWTRRRNLLWNLDRDLPLACGAARFLWSRAR